MYERNSDFFLQFIQNEMKIFIFLFIIFDPCVWIAGLESRVEIRGYWTDSFHNINCIGKKTYGIQNFIKKKKSFEFHFEVADFMEFISIFDLKIQKNYEILRYENLTEWIQ